jgi:hypothetical protein
VSRKPTVTRSVIQVDAPAVDAASEPVVRDAPVAPLQVDVAPREVLPAAGSEGRLLSEYEFYLYQVKKDFTEARQLLRISKNDVKITRALRERAPEGGRLFNAQQSFWEANPERANALFKGPLW